MLLYTKGSVNALNNALLQFYLFIEMFLVKNTYQLSRSVQIVIEPLLRNFVHCYAANKELIFFDDSFCTAREDTALRP